MDSVDDRLVKFIKSIRPVVGNVANILSKFDDSPDKLDAESGKLTAVLLDIDRRMELFIDEKAANAEKRVLRNMLIFRLRDFLQDSIIINDIRKTVLFDVGDREFARIFKHALHLQEMTEIPYDEGNGYGPRYDNYMPPLDPGGVEYSRSSKSKPPGPMGQNLGIYYQYSILDNLHKRLTALEHRMGD